MQTEKEMREATVPTFSSAEELQKYIDGLVTQEHDYGTCVYAMSIAATATFNYVANVLGVTGFQASMADLDIIRRTRHMKGPFMLLKGEDLLYPQYDLHQKVDEFEDDCRDWLRDEAKRMIAEQEDGEDWRKEYPPHPDVMQRWKDLASE
jgi:hypothetical protein